MSEDEIQSLVEKKYLQCILGLTKSGKITDIEVKTTAQVMQAMRPWTSIQDALMKCEFLSQKFPLLTPLFEYMQIIIGEEKTKDLIDSMHTHLKNNEIDEALQIAKNYTE